MLGCFVLNDDDRSGTHSRCGLCEEEEKRKGEASSRGEGGVREPKGVGHASPVPQQAGLRAKSGQVRSS